MVGGTLDGRYDEILGVLREIVAPLIEADGCQLFLIPCEGPRIAIHLTGRQAGAPGIGLVGRRIVEPALKTVAPDSPVVLSTGWRIPEGAIRIESKP